MIDFEKTKLDLALRDFTNRHFEKPNKCKDLDQIRFCVGGLCEKIEEYETKYQFVPEWAYLLLNQYNQAQNSLLYNDFRKMYAL